MEDLFLASFMWLASTVQLAVAFRQLRGANPHEKIPMFFGRPGKHPGEIYFYRAIAFFLLMLSVLAWAEVIGFWSVLLIVIAMIPIAILNVQHNRRVQSQSPELSGSY